MEQPKRLPRRSLPEKSLSDLKARLTKDGALEKRAAESHRRRDEAPYSPHHSGILPIKIDLNQPDYLKNLIGETTEDAIA